MSAENQNPEDEKNAEPTEQASIEASVQAAAEAETMDEATVAWEQALQRLGLGEVDLTAVTTKDILYLAKRWQFLQVVESSGEKPPFEVPEILEAPSGWWIHHYGDAMCTSPGRFMYGGGYFRTSGDDDDEGGSGIVNPEKGTVIKQAFDTAAEIVRLAKHFGWGGIMVVDGHPDMQRAAWVEAVRIGIRLDGYEPGLADEKVRRRIVSPSIERMQAAIKALKG